MFAAWSRVRRSKQPAACARKVLLNRHLLDARPRTAFPACEPCHRGWNRTLVPSSGEDLRPWWPTARSLPRSTRTSSPPQNSQWPRRPLVLTIFIRQGWPQAMSHLPAVPSACPSQRLRAVTSGQRRLVEVGLTWPFGVGAGTALPRSSVFQARAMGHGRRRWARSDQGQAGGPWR